MTYSTIRDNVADDVVGGLEGGSFLGRHVINKSTISGNVANSIGGLQDEDYLELGRRLRPPQFDALPPDVRELGPSYRAANPEGARRWMDLERTSRPDGPEAPAQPLRNRLTFALIEGIKVPTLLITGGADLYAPPPIQRLFAARIKGAQSVVAPEAGHSTYWEQPEVFNRAVLEFIRKH